MERKSIGVLTFHMAHNYGAMLQAYAMPIAVRKLGYKCEVINYRFPYIDNWSRIDYLDDLIKKYGIIGGGLRFIKRYIKGCYNYKTARYKFSYFERNIIFHSEELFEEEELNNLKYDCILFGSDQIWNSNLTNGIASAYIGNFKTLNYTRKIAYAASCGNSKFNENCEDMYLKCLKDFYAIGVRENGLAENLKLRGLEPMVVLDPTLLLTKEEWIEMVERVPYKIDVPKNYLLIYAFDEDDQIYTLARDIAKKMNLEIVVIAYNKKVCMNNMKVYTNCGPADFLNFIENAKFVVTTSFHGTVFSILMRKEFYCIPHPKYHERTDSLLKIVDLECRNILNFEKFKMKEEINWNKVELLLARERKKSYDFLRKSIQ